MFGFILNNTHDNKVFSSAIMNNYYQILINKHHVRDIDDYQHRFLHENHVEILEQFHLDMVWVVYYYFENLFQYLFFPLKIEMI